MVVLLLSEQRISRSGTATTSGIGGHFLHLFEDDAAVGVASEGLARFGVFETVLAEEQAGRAAVHEAQHDEDLVEQRAEHVEQEYYGKGYDAQVALVHGLLLLVGGER